MNRYRYLLLLILSAFLGYASVAVSNGIMVISIDHVNAAAGCNLDAGQTDASSVLYALALMMSLGASAALIASALVALRPILGFSYRVAAGIFSVLGFCFCLSELWPLSEYLLHDWRWCVAVLWSAILGALIGSAITRGFSKVYAYFLPFLILASAELTIWIVYSPAQRMLMEYLAGTGGSG